MKTLTLSFLIIFLSVFSGVSQKSAEGMDQVKELPPCLKEKKDKGEKSQFNVAVQVINANNWIMKSSTIALRGVVDDQVFDIARNRFGEPAQTPVLNSAYEATFARGCMTKVSFVYEGAASWETMRSPEKLVRVSSEMTSDGAYEVSDPLRESIRSCDIKISINFEYAKTPGEEPEIIGKITCLTKRLVNRNKYQK